MTFILLKEIYCVKYYKILNLFKALCVPSRVSVAIKASSSQVRRAEAPIERKAH